MQWLTERRGSVYVGMTSRGLLEECFCWLTARGTTDGGKNRAALLHAAEDAEEVDDEEDDVEDEEDDVEDEDDDDEEDDDESEV